MANFVVISFEDMFNEYIFYVKSLMICGRHRQLQKISFVISLNDFKSKIPKNKPQKRSTFKKVIDLVEKLFLIQ